MPDTQSAITWLEKATEAKNVFTGLAYVHLADLYYFGRHDLLPNYEKAFAVDTKAALKDYPRAQFNLGCAYYYGEGTVRDLDLAIHWYRKCVEQGKEDSEQAKSALANCYLEKSTAYYNELLTSPDRSLSLEAREVLTSQG